MTDETIEAHGTPSQARAIEIGSDAAFVFLGTWTLLQQLSYFCGLTFVQTWCLAWAGSAIAVLLWIRGCEPTSGASATQDTSVGWALPAAVLVAVLLALCLSRPDGDDEDYLGHAMIALDHKSLPMPSAPAMDRGYSLASYEPLKASISWATRIPLLATHFFVVPAIVATLIIIVQWRLYTLLHFRNRAMALLGLIVIMLAWGDVHRTPSNFGLVRLFHGKGALVWLLVFAGIIYWCRLVERRDGRSISLMLLVAAAGVGLSPTGVPLGIVTFGLFIISTLIDGALRPNLRVLLGLLLPFAYLVTVGLVMRFYFGHANLGVSAEDGVRLFVPIDFIAPGVAPTKEPGFVYTIEMIGIVLGQGGRAGIALLCAAALPLTLRASPRTRLLSIYSGLCSALLLLPWTSQWLAKWSFATMSWRWLYAVPFVLGMVAALDRIDDLTLPLGARRTILAMAFLLFVFASPRWVVSVPNSTRVSMPSYKLADPTGITIRPYQKRARIEGPWIVSPLTGLRY